MYGIEQEGKTFVADLLGCKVNLDNPNKILDKLIQELPVIINMTPIVEPKILEWMPPNCPIEKGGYTGYVIIAESHIAFHTWIYKKLVNIDISSCNDFDHMIVYNYVDKLFEPELIIHHEIPRY
jgi:S-adenosylmethionine decarboxylase